MSNEEALRARGDNRCELCRSAVSLGVFEVPPDSDGTPDACVLLCAVCRDGVGDPNSDAQHWRPLAESMWTTVPAVQVMIWRILMRLRPHSWAEDLLAMLYLDDATLTWARAMGDDGDTPDQAPVAPS